MSKKEYYHFKFNGNAFAASKNVPGREVMKLLLRKDGKFKRTLVLDDGNYQDGKLVGVKQLADGTKVCLCNVFSTENANDMENEYLIVKNTCLMLVDKNDKVLGYSKYNVNLNESQSIEFEMVKYDKENELKSLFKNYTVPTIKDGRVVDDLRSHDKNALEWALPVFYKDDALTSEKIRVVDLKTNDFVKEQEEVA